MNHIDARTQASLKSGVMELLNLSEEEMVQIFTTIHKDGWNDPLTWAREYLSDCIVDERLDYIQMFHLSRRLNGTDLKAGSNLKELLLEESPLSNFFRGYGVTFRPNEDHIDLYYNGELQPLDDEFRYENGNIYYLRSRFGYNSGSQDYCINGFAFRPSLENNSYFRQLSRCPELVENIGWLLDIRGMRMDYYNRSKYYCIEYLIPMSEVIFDENNPPENNREKTIEILSQAILSWGMDLMTGAFRVAQGMVTTIMDSSGLTAMSATTLPDELVSVIEDVGFIDSIPLWAVTLLGSLFIWVLSLVMILTVYSRFFKLYIATAIAPIPLASFAGQPSSSIGVAFLKSYAAICMEGCVIVLACVIFSAFASSPPAIADDTLAAATIVWNYVGELIFNMLVLVGAIKMSDRIIRELMGLG